jgi:hypothetical protein
VVFQGSNSQALSIDTGDSSVTTSASVTVFDAMGNTVATEGGGRYSETVALVVGEVYSVTMGASVMVDAGLNTTLASASVDPMFTPPPDYSITYSANLAGAVPEPPTWILALAGFGLVGFVTRRRAKSTDPTSSSERYAPRGRPQQARS